MRRFIFIALALALATVGALGVVNILFLRPTGLRVAVARDTDDHKLIQVIARVLASERDNVRLRVTPVNSAAAAAAALEAGEVDLAVVRSDIALPPSGQTLVILHRNPVLLIARGDANFSGVADLKGKTIGVVRGVASGEGNLQLLDRILAQYDLSPETVKRQAFDRADAIAAMKAGHLDAVLVVAPITADIVGDAVNSVSQASGGVSFVPIGEAKAMAQRNPAFESTEIVRGAFAGNPPRPANAFDTLAVTSRLMARPTVSDGVAGDLTRLLFTNRLTIAQSAPLANQIEAPSTTKGATLPVHPGAAAYLDDEEEGFFDKYSDVIYIGAMLLSVVGSGFVALASRIAANSHTEADRLLARLLEILRAARVTSSSEELDQLEHETDEILMAGISNRKLHGIDSQVMSAMALALDQARQAIRERRLLLAATPRPT
ncbi:MAG: TAXI family TRAP transporter solute-binding subunit [Hyphomicrobiales bacterium]|nr:TAXI family TRAP transporter solute-binding subunit [Hyphomicrobiales bacterium]